MKAIALRYRHPRFAGKVALVSDKDYPRVAPFKWHIVADKRVNGRLNFYAARYRRGCKGKNTVEYLHRLVLNVRASQQVDHKNRDGLDCRRSNLRLATTVQNRANSVAESSNQSGYKGVATVTYRREGKPVRVVYRASITVDGVRRTLGEYAEPIVAAEIYDEAAREAWGTYAFTNFPRKGASR